MAPSCLSPPVRAFLVATATFLVLGGIAVVVESPATATEFAMGAALFAVVAGFVGTGLCVQGHPLLAVSALLLGPAALWVGFVMVFITRDNAPGLGWLYCLLGVLSLVGALLPTRRPATSTP